MAIPHKRRSGRIHSKERILLSQRNAPVENMVLRSSSLLPSPLSVLRLDGFPSPEPPDHRRLTFFDERSGRAFRELHRGTHKEKEWDETRRNAHD